MASSKVTGHMLKYKRGDCVQFPNYDVGIVTGRLCRPVAKVEVWGDCGYHAVVNRSLRKAFKISRDALTQSSRYIACMNENALSDTAQAILSGDTVDQCWND